MKKVLPIEPVVLTPEEVSTLYAGLRTLYHDLNNSMTVISGACILGQEALGQEKIAEGKRMFAMLARTLGDPNKILQQLRSFGSMLENHLKIEEKPEEDETSARIGISVGGTKDWRKPPGIADVKSPPNSYSTTIRASI